MRKNAEFHRSRRGILLVCLSLLGLYPIGNASAAAYATGGAGQYRNQVLWLTWGGGLNGTNGVALTNGSISTATINLGTSTIIINCVLQNIVQQTGSGGLVSYRPGNWTGDGLDDLYNIGGTGGANQLIAGISNAVTGSRLQFDVACTATFDGLPYKLAGIVVADAEQSASNEYVEGIADGAWEIMELSENCTTAPYNGTLSLAGTIETLRLSGGSPLCGTGPSGIGFLTFNATAFSGASYQISPRFTMQGGGGSAIAIGILFPWADSGDAPSSYGTALHIFNSALTPDGLIVGNTVNIAAAGFVFSTFSSPATDKLGSLEDNDGRGLVGNATATTDDQTDIDDEDAVNVATLPALVHGQAIGQPYVVPVACTGSGFVRGWIDFNRDGDFLDANESSATVACSGGSASLGFTRPAAQVAGTSYLRIRYTVATADLAQPSGVFTNGEVEDHVINIVPAADLILTKTNTPGINGELDQATDTVTSGGASTYTITATNLGPDAANGAVVTDPAPSNLICATATCVAASGAVCPAQTGAALITALQGAGATIPVLPVGGRVSFVLTCTVQ